VNARFSSVLQIGGLKLWQGNNVVTQDQETTDQGITDQEIAVTT
jgi:hypothetical protein